MKIHLGVAIAVLALGAMPARASDLTETIRETLDNLDEQVEQARVWKFHVRPRFSQSVIWTDNVYLNADNEQPFKLTGVAGPNGLVTSKQKLRQIQRRTADFQPLESQGRVADYILKSELGASLVLPHNLENYSKIFKTDEITILDARLRRHEYLDENVLDNTDFAFKTDVFGFLSDILDVQHGNRFYVRGAADWSRLEEPLDTDIVELQQIGIASVDFRRFERTEWEVRGDVGYRHNRLDVSVGARYLERRLEDRELRQAEYDRLNLHALASYELPQVQGKTVYVRADVDEHEPNDRAGTGGQQALNDGDRYRVVAGIEGFFFSKKLAGRAGVGYEAWDTDENSGLSGDRSDFHSPVGEVELAYRPWEERSTQIQLSYNRTTTASAISNFNSVHRGTITATHQLQQDLMGTVSFGFTRTEASEGPKSKLYDVGLGVTYDWFEQLSVSMRYSYRYSNSWDEIFIQSSFVSGPREFIYTSESDGDFDAHTLEVALELTF